MQSIKCKAYTYKPDKRWSSILVFMETQILYRLIFSFDKMQLQGSFSLLGVCCGQINNGKIEISDAPRMIMWFM